MATIRIETGAQHKGAGNLGYAEAGGLHLGRQAAQGAGCAVLHVYSRDIKVTIQFKRSGNAAGTIIAAGGVHVAHVFRAVDGLLQQRGDTGFHRLRIRAGVERAHGDLGRRKIRELRNRQQGNRDRACQHDQQRANSREYRTTNEKIDHEESFWIMTAG